MKKFVPPGKERRDETLMLSWWFGPDALATRAGFEKLVGLLRMHFPDALPRRYGSFEPPEYRLSETGEAHLVTFLATGGRESMPFLFPHLLVTNFTIHLPEQFGQSPGWPGFRANMTSIQILAATLQQPGWERQIRRFWREMSEFLQPFYGDVRFVLSVQPHPVRAWFWRGFPSTSGVVAVLGQPYLDLWPQCAEARMPEERLAYLSGETWDATPDLYEGMGGVPTSLSQSQLLEH